MILFTTMMNKNTLKSISNHFFKTNSSIKFSKNRSNETLRILDILENIELLKTIKIASSQCQKHCKLAISLYTG